MGRTKRSKLPDMVIQWDFGIFVICTLNYATDMFRLVALISVRLPYRYHLCSPKIFNNSKPMWLDLPVELFHLVAWYRMNCWYFAFVEVSFRRYKCAPIKNVPSKSRNVKRNRAEIEFRQRLKGNMEGKHCESVPKWHFWGDWMKYVYASVKC